MSGSGDFSIGSDRWPGLSKLIEEMGEVQQVVGKLIATGGEAKHWDGTDLRDRLQEELGDLLGAIAFVEDHCGLDQWAIAERALRKRRLFDKWHEDQRPKPVCVCGHGQRLHQRGGFGGCVAGVRNEAGGNLCTCRTFNASRGPT